MTSPLLEVSNLRIRLQTHRGPADAVRGVSFSLARGETLGLIGESGCGKSITAMSLMGLLPESAQVTGSIRFDGQELVGRTDARPRLGRFARMLPQLLAAQAQPLVRADLRYTNGFALSWGEAPKAPPPAATPSPLPAPIAAAGRILQGIT